MNNNDSGLLEIKYLCEKLIAHANEHAAEIRQMKETDMIKSENKIKEILSSAVNSVKHSYEIYETFRHQLSRVAVNSQQYDSAIKQLTTILEV